MKKRKNKKGFSIKEQYKLSWKFILESRKFIYFTVLLFFVIAFVGYFVPAPMSIQNSIMDYLKQVVAQTEGMNHPELIRFIFFNNVQVGFFGLIFGALFGIFPLAYIIGNGYILGFVSALAVKEGGPAILLKLLPHGIFELPAIFISLSLGLKLGSFILEKDKGATFREYFWNSLRVFLYIVVPLLIIAAIIEGSLI